MCHVFSLRSNIKRYIRFIFCNGEMLVSISFRKKNLYGIFSLRRSIDNFYSERENDSSCSDSERHLSCWPDFCICTYWHYFLKTKPNSNQKEKSILSKKLILSELGCWTCALGICFHYYCVRYAVSR